MQTAVFSNAAQCRLVGFGRRFRGAARLSDCPDDGGRRRSFSTRRNIPQDCHLHDVSFLKSATAPRPRGTSSQWVFATYWSSVKQSGIVSGVTLHTKWLFRVLFDDAVSVGRGYMTREGQSWCRALVACTKASRVWAKFELGAGPSGHEPS
jgi:hypothetical protein